MFEVASWSSLPDHVLVTIFSYLSLQERYYASIVCRSWQECFQSPYLWHRFDFWFYQPKHSQYLQCLDTHGQQLRSVFIGLNQAIAENRVNACKVLQSFSNVDMRKISAVTIKFTGENPLFYSGIEFVESLKILFGPISNGIQPPLCQITSVDLSGLSAPFGDSVFDILSINNPDLEKLNVQNKCLICKASPCCILRLVNRCRKLRDLRVFHCSLVDDILFALAEDNREPIKHLAILCRREEKYTRDLSGEAWSALVKKCPNLAVTLGFDHNCPLFKVPVIMKEEIPVKVLNLETFTVIFDEVNMAAAYYSATLEKVVLQTRNSKQLGDALLNLAQKCKKLRSLLVYCVLKKEVVDEILNLFPDMRERGSYILKWEMEPEPWVVGLEEDYCC